MAPRMHTGVSAQTGAKKIMSRSTKAIRIHAQGGPEFLKYEEAPNPRLATGDVLVQVRDAGVTPAKMGRNDSYQNIEGSHRVPSNRAGQVSGIKLRPFAAKG